MAPPQTLAPTRPWFIPVVESADRERMLDHVEALEATRVSYALPLVLGMMGGILVAVGLLLASL